MDTKTQTINTYNDSAHALANKFDRLGARVSDITETFALVHKDNPKVLEVGCGNGRDAHEILKHTNDYLGIDVSEKLVELARQKVPHGEFLVADIETYRPPPDLDFVFAFASLIHVPRESFQRILHAVFGALNEGGAFRISLKYAEQYTESTKTDEFGTRTYYLYSNTDIAEMVDGFTIVKSEIGDLRGQMWLEVLLQK